MPPSQLQHLGESSGGGADGGGDDGGGGDGVQSLKFPSSSTPVFSVQDFS